MNSQTQNNHIKSPIILHTCFSQKKLIKNLSIKKANEIKRRSLSNIQNKKEKTKIIWSEGGKQIYLTGSFCHWDDLYLMKKDNKEEFFYCVLDLPKGFHQFRFKVDGKWKISTIYPQFNVRGKVNNCLNNSVIDCDNTSISTCESSVLSTINKKYLNVNNSLNVNNYINLNNNSKIDFSYSRNNYCNYYPKKNEMKNIKIPNHFQTECYHGVNQLQNKIGNKKYLYLVEDSVFSGNDSYKNIEKKEHTLINHYCKRQIKNDIFISSVSVKYRLKNVTLLYYRQRNNL